MKSQLYLWQPLMEKHKKQLSLVEDYYYRTRIVFEGIGKESEDYSKSQYLNYTLKEGTDPSLVSIWAIQQGTEMLETLSIMKYNHLLMTISMLYHIWEQQMIITIHKLPSIIELDKKGSNINKFKTIFKSHGINIQDKAWKCIWELTQLVNTIKHGEGDSADKLRALRPDFFDLSFISDAADSLKLNGAVLLDDFSLQVEERDLVNYIYSTKSFWNEMQSELIQMERPH